jgi:hypothetical protein
MINAAGAFERRAALVAAKRTRCRTSEIAGWVGVVVARRADTLTRTPLRLNDQPRLTARFSSLQGGGCTSSGSAQWRRHHASFSCARDPESRESAAVAWPEATPFCERHLVPKQGLKKGVAEQEESSVPACEAGCSTPRNPDSSG